MLLVVGIIIGANLAVLVLSMCMAGSR